MKRTVKLTQSELKKMISESVKRILKETVTDIPIDCGSFTEFSQSNPVYSSYSYFGNCVNSWKVFGDATTMAQFINGCTIIKSEYVIGKLKDGDRRIPSEFTNNVRKILENGQIDNHELIVTGIDTYQKILFVYLTNTDKHYFFDCNL